MENNFSWYDYRKKSVYRDKFINWFDNNYHEIFGDDIAKIGYNVRLYKDKCWLSATDTLLKSHLIEYFRQFDISLSVGGHIAELIKRVRLFGEKNIIKIDYTGGYRRKIAIPFNNGTLYIYPKDTQKKFVKGKWEKSDYNLYYLTEDYADDLWDMDINESIIGGYFNEYFTPDAKKLMKLFFGSLLIPTCINEVALYIFSKGRSGKNTLTNTLGSLFVDDAVSYIKMDSLGRRFSNTNLINAVLNVASEINERSKASEDALKEMIASDPAQFEDKFERPYSGKPLAKHIFLANGFPNVSMEYALKERLRFIRQTKVPEVRSVAFKEEFMKQRRYLLAFMLQGLLEFILNDFELSEGDDVYEELVREADNTADFIFDELVVGKDYKCWDDEIYKAYGKWHEENLSGTSSNKIALATLAKKINRLLGHHHCISSQRKRRDGKRHNQWFGITLRERLKPEDTFCPGFPGYVQGKNMQPGQLLS